MTMANLIAALSVTALMLATGAMSYASTARGAKYELVTKGEYVLQLPDGTVIVNCQRWSWRRIGIPSSETPIIKHHPAYVVCGGGAL